MASQQGTISIAFNTIPSCLDFSYNSNTTLTSSDTDWLLDPLEPQNALQRLRILKTRNTGDLQVTPNIIGREYSNPINFDKITYNTRQMRRKAEILKHKHNIGNSTNNLDYSYYSKSGKSKYRHMTNQRIKDLKQQQTCLNPPPISKPSSNSGIFGGGNKSLIMDTNIEYNDKL